MMLASCADESTSQRSPSKSMDYSSHYRLRAAQAKDQAAIRALIREVRINPLGLDWRRFVVAMDHENNLLGCGQIKRHQDGSHELASVAVAEGWRRKGIATGLIQHLLNSGVDPIWLMCRYELVAFYEKFDFHIVHQIKDMPPYFQRVMKLWNALSKLPWVRQGGKVMVWSRDGKAG